MPQPGGKMRQVSKKQKKKESLHGSLWWGSLGNWIEQHHEDVATSQTAIQGGGTKCREVSSWKIICKTNNDTRQTVKTPPVAE